jgi:hypothetical protein
MTKSRYLGFQGERLRWVERAIATTDQWIKEASDEASVEIVFSRTYSWDYDDATDQQAAAEKARATLKLLEEERDAILARKAHLQRDVEAGKYDDER